MSARRTFVLTLALAAALLGSLLLWTTLGQRFLGRYVHHGLRLVTLSSGLDTPWSLAFLPDGRMLVTERIGRMRLIPPSGGPGTTLAGLPPVLARSEAGLLGVTVDPEFATNHRIFWSYVEPDATGTNASLAVARAVLSGTQLTQVQVICRDPEKTEGAGSFGSRLLFDRAGHLFVTVGVRNHHPDAQRLDSIRGKILRMQPDGSVPPDNPFVGRAGVHPLIWAIGFRDPQGIALDPVTGRLWADDHGPGGGDELNLIEAGRNYGWPLITDGVDESSGRHLTGTSKPGMERPVISWVEPGTPPTGMDFLMSDRYPGWKHQLFVGTLWNQALLRIEVDDTRAHEAQRLYTGEYSRVRDVRQGPDGWLYVLTNLPDGRILRLER